MHVAWPDRRTIVEYEMSDLRGGTVGETSPADAKAVAPRHRASAGGARTGRRRARKKAPSRGKRILRTAAMGLSVLILATAGAGWWFYQHLNGNLHTVSLTDGAGGAGKETPDAFGRTPINILVMGSDGRNLEADCKLGGGCAKTGVQSGGNADVQMVVHISADRSNATMMSIPRDTLVDIPACTDQETGASTPGYHGMINGALAYGPACQVATVHQLTGIPIDHFVQLGFSGVVTMSDAVGGVGVCVSSDVYDTYSHLKLSRGEHTLKGEAALQFVRSRHGFGDGSDLGRTYSQHIFLSSMLRKFKSAGTLTNPAAVYRLADAATKALTVDTGLGTVKKLVSLAADVARVPTDRITFTTMQTVPDPDDENRVVLADAAKSLFATIVADQSLTGDAGEKQAKNTASPTPSATATASPAPASGIAVDVRNGTTTPGRASAIGAALIEAGFASGGTTGNAAGTTDTTTLSYGAGRLAEAQTVADALGLPSSHLERGGTGLTLVIGGDWTSGTSYPGSGASPEPADTASAAAGAHARTADTSGTCAEVSPYKTVEINGVPMTPAQAYRAAGDKADSDG